MQFNTSKSPLFPLDAADEANSAKHTTRNIDYIPIVNIVTGESAGRWGNHVVLRRVAQDRIETVALTNIGDTGEGGRGEGSQRGFARKSWWKEPGMRYECGFEIGGRSGRRRTS